jgi:hypothetical protein
MSGARANALGATRVCPHCKATVLASASVCPGCQHHLRFNPADAQAAPAGYEAVQIAGTIQHREPGEACEYCVVLSVDNARGDKITRQVVSVGALQPAELHRFNVSIQLLPSRTALPPKRD